MEALPYVMCHKNALCSTMRARFISPTVIYLSLPSSTSWDSSILPSSRVLPLLHFHWKLYIPALKDLQSISLWVKLSRGAKSGLQFEKFVYQSNESK